jgi:CxxC motif-containing protein (DUF1111 family)
MPDGSSYELRRPILSVDWLLGPAQPTTKMGLRIAPALHGLGALSQIDGAALVSQADSADADSDGISGRLPPHGPGIGFGWRGDGASVHDQVARAFAEDLGVTSADLPQQLCPRVPACGDAVSGGEPEVSQQRFDALVDYVESLPPPATPAAGDGEMPGRDIFDRIGCASCHRPAVRLMSGQTIAPYSDLLLHDLGNGLADEVRPSSVATGEWRTPPLWGMRNRIDRASLLHDGRARTVAEAILWHSGEAALSTERFANLTAADREALEVFIASL